MAFSGYIKIPDIDGESKASEHEDEIDCWGVSWGVEQASYAAGARRARRRADVGPLVCYKFYDVASPYLALACRQGRHFDEIVFTVRKDSGEAHLDYLVITMKNVTITSYQMHNTDRDDPDERIVERVQFDAEDMDILYRLQKRAGGVVEHEVNIDAF